MGSRSFELEVTLFIQSFGMLLQCVCETSVQQVIRYGKLSLRQGVNYLGHLDLSETTRISAGTVRRRLSSLLGLMAASSILIEIISDALGFTLDKPGFTSDRLGNRPDSDFGDPTKCVFLLF